MSAESIRAKIEAAEDLVEIPVHVDEWDVDLLLLSPTVVERSDMIERYTKYETDVDGQSVAHVDLHAMATSLLIACLHDPETRERLFHEADAAMLGAKNGAVVDKISKKCLPLVGFAAEGATEAGKDDSSTTPSDDTESHSLAVSVGH